MRKFAFIFVTAVTGLLLVFIAASAAFAGWVVWYYSAQFDLPTVERLLAVSPADRICSSAGERIYVPLAAIPLKVRNAILAADEPEFYNRWTTNAFSEIAHAHLFDHRPRSFAISWSVMHCLRSLSTERHKHHGNWIVFTIMMNRVDSNLPKDLIFEIYLNETYFGRGAYGVGAAAAALFGKPVADLTLDEAACLAALARAPGYLRNTERWTERRNFVIDRMQAAGAITASEAAAAKQQPLAPRPAPAPT